MATPTPNWGIHRWDDTTPVAPLQDFFNTQADDLENALDSAAVGWFLQYATKDAMAAVPGTRVGQHATVYADSTASKNGGYIWNGVTWGREVSVFGATAAALSFLLPPTSNSVVTGLSLTTSTPAVPVIVRASLQVENSNSGSDRTVALQLYQDGTALGVSRNFLVPYSSGLSVITCVEISASTTPTAGTHTYTVKGNASIASAIAIRDCTLDVTTDAGA